jgi:hypothetical protein
VAGPADRNASGGGSSTPGDLERPAATRHRVPPRACSPSRCAHELGGAAACPAGARQAAECRALPYRDDDGTGWGTPWGRSWPVVMSPGRHAWLAGEHLACVRTRAQVGIWPAAVQASTASAWATYSSWRRIRVRVLPAPAKANQTARSIRAATYADASDSPPCQPPRRHQPPGRVHQNPDRSPGQGKRSPASDGADQLGE